MRWVFSRVTQLPVSLDTPVSCLYASLRWPRGSRKVAGSIPDEVTGFFNWPNPSSRTMVLGSTQPLTEMSKGRPASEADITAICQPIV
jgi:hypothetical protein